MPFFARCFCTRLATVAMARTRSQGQSRSRRRARGRIVCLLFYLLFFPVPRPLSRSSERTARIELPLANRRSCELSTMLIPRLILGLYILLLVFAIALKPRLKQLPPLLLRITCLLRVKVLARAVSLKTNFPPLRYSPLLIDILFQDGVCASRPVATAHDKITVFVRGTLGELYTLSNLPSNSKTTILFELMESKTGVPTRITRLFLKQKAVQRDQNFQELGIRHGCSLDLLVRGSGGGTGI